MQDQPTHLSWQTSWQADSKELGYQLPDEAPAELQQMPAGLVQLQSQTVSYSPLRYHLR